MVEVKSDKNQILRYFDTKLSSALLATLRQDIVKLNLKKMFSV